MIDILQSKVIGTNKETWYKLAGTSADTKPTGEFPVGTGHTVANGSRLYELDTEILYELKNNSWQPIGQAEYKLQDKTVTPTTSDQSISADTGYYGLGTVTVKGSSNNGEFINKTTFDPKSTLKSITIPSGVTTISQSAFSNYNELKSVVLPEGIKTLKSYAFSNCSKLDTINLPNSITSIESYAFQSCAFESIDLPNISEIPSFCFASTDLKQITIPSSVTTIGGSVFNRCSSLEYVELPNSLTSMGQNPFGNCINLTTIRIHQKQSTSPIAASAPWGATNATVVWDEE